ncbi:MAG: GGDEF domain-containing response regulator [Halothiobacillus sp.]
MTAHPSDNFLYQTESVRQPINWPLAGASLKSAFSDQAVKRHTRLADLTGQAEHMRECARRGHQSQLANALDRLLHAIQRERISPSEDFSRIDRLIRHVDRIIQNDVSMMEHGPVPLALLLSEHEPSEVLLDALNRYGYISRTLHPKIVNNDQLKSFAEQAELIIVISNGEESASLVRTPLEALGDFIKNRFSLLISSQDSFSYRAAAVKMGMTHFLTEPLDINRLNSILQSSRILDDEKKPIQVLMIDDMITAGVYWGKHFQQQNIIFRFESKPEQAYRSAIEIVPDIILLDLYMPEIDGVDLAKIFREHPLLHDVPILFMSTEEDDRCRMEAKMQGGDDFLNKTIPIDDLLKLVRYRALRYRQSSAEKRSDSLTGLMNHNAIKDLIDAEIDRANRQDQNLTVALLDIDHFKKVNDVYGHQAGDIVIRKLSNLLNTRLRRYDGVGRYGGEEFMIVLPNTDETTAAHLINRLRIHFGQTSVAIGDNQSILCTFSAGIASFPRHSDMSSLIEAADRNLYIAKKNGRNRVACDQFERNR